MSKELAKNHNKNVSKIVAVGISCLIMGIIIGAVAWGLIQEEKNKNTEEITDYQKKGNLKLGEYKELALNLDVSDEDVQAAIESLLEEYPEYEHLDGPVKAGDTVSIDFEGKIDGESFEGGSGEDSLLEIGSEEFTKDFEEQIIGMNPGETKEFTITYPDDDYYEELIGKKAVFTLNLNYIAGEELETDFDDAFVKKVSDGEFQTVETYKEFIKENLYNENVENKAALYWNLVIENIEIYEVDTEEYNKKYKEIQDYYNSIGEMFGVSYEELLSEWEMTEDDIQTEAFNQAFERMIAKTIAKVEGISMDDEYYHNAIKEILYNEDDPDTDWEGMSIEDLEEYYLDSFVSDPKEDMLVEYVKTYLAETAVISNQ